MRFFSKLLLVCIFITVAFFKTSEFAVNGQSQSQQKRQSFVNIVNPVRGDEFWNHEGKPLDNVKSHYDAIAKRNLAATWLIRFDALTNPEMTPFFKSLPQNQEMGILFEITPRLTSQAGVSYNESGSWHKAKSVFLTGYSVDDRKKLITTAFEEFRNTFGFYPKSVGAWWIDANSLSFMKEKYGIKSSLVVADQFSTDDYQVWGLYFSTPYYPSKVNALVPAKDKAWKLDIVNIQWAARDPFNAYGGGAQESTYSVQPNDYQVFHNLDISYFEKLLDIYTNPPAFSKFGQITIGLENDFGFEKEYERQLDAVINRKLNVVTMSGFADWYRTKFPDVSPAHLITTDDPLGSEGKVVWFMNPFYRAGWFYHPTLYGSAIRDLRNYNDSIPEPCYQTFCANLDLSQSVSKPLDEATYQDRWTIDEGEISNYKLAFTNDSVNFGYINEGGKPRTIEFKYRDIFIEGEGIPISEAISKALNLENQEKGKISFSFQEKSVSQNWLKFTFQTLIFIIFVIFALTLPGFFLNRKLSLTFFEKLVFGTVVGIVLLALISFILGYLRLQFLVFPTIFLISILGLWQVTQENLKVNINKANLILAVLILLGVFSQIAVVIKSGLPYPFGLGFWGPNGHDAIWHLAIISELKNHFPPENPAFAGVALKNYHYFADLVIAQTAKLTQISSLDLLFRLFPLLISILLGATTFLFVRRITRSRLAALIATFLVYFGGSLGWIVTLIREGKIGGESMFWANQSVSFLLNPPFAFSMIIVITFLSLLWLYLKTSDKFYLPLLILLAGTVVQFKAYAAFLVFSSLLLLLIYEAVVKKNFRILKIFIPALTLFGIVFLPIYQASQSLLVFSPFWFIHTMAIYQDRLNWLKLSNARLVYIEMGWWPKLILAEILGLLIFVIGNLGTRLIAIVSIWYWFRSKNKIEPFWLFIFAFLLISFIIPLFFIQQGTAWNTIQFFYYFLFLTNIIAAISLAKLLRLILIRFRYFVLIVFCLITIPTSASTIFYHYLPNRAPARIPYGELQALDFLKIQPQGIVLARTFNESIREKFDLPRPLFVYETTAYVSAFSEKRTFIEDEVNQNIIGLDYKPRVVATKEFFRTHDVDFQNKLLSENNIKYIYITKLDRFELNEEKLKVKKIFDNEESRIYAVI